MNELANLLERIIQRVNINLRELGIDVAPRVRALVPFDQMVKFYAFYGITPHHPLDLRFRHSNLAGSYFLGNIRVTNSLLYKSDIRGDELKKKGKLCGFGAVEIPLNQDEEIDIADSFLVKTLVHSSSHDPESPERFFIKDTVSTHYANIHGSPSHGCFLGPFSTVDLTTVRDCVIGTFCYIQAGEVSHLNVDPGTVWVRSPGRFNFLYRYAPDRLNEYISFLPGSAPRGLFMDFANNLKEAFQSVFDRVNVEQTARVPDSASLDRFAVTLPPTHIGENVLVAQRAYLEDAWLGTGANAQENCCILHSRLEGCNVTAHGARIIQADLDRNTFVGFNSFLRGRPERRLTVGESCIVMPHTIIDCREPVSVPAGHLVWGLITDPRELATHSVSLKHLSGIRSGFSRGNMFFEGDGALFVSAFQDRIGHILEANGAFFDGDKTLRGHAQRNQNISFNTLQPYPEGDLEGLYPTIIIQP